ncbi:MAG: hypothetical protein JWP59_2445 [Massilia sp.]|nr:hypothetical protein [Massilia sp.]
MSLAAGEAVAAKTQGTFGVGGVLLDQRGNVLKSLHNMVVRDGLIFDPTAHGERQLIDWYFAERARGAALPDPHELTIVTSLDPCAMCAGAILAAGFKVVVAADDAKAGIDHDASARFSALPAALRERAAAAFCYPAVRGSAGYARAARGSAPPAFFIGKTINEATQALCSLALEATSDKVQQVLHQDVPQASLLDPATLSNGHPIVRKLKSLYPNALSWRGAPQAPDATLAPYLQAAMEQDRRQGGDGDCSALLDAFGNLLLVTPGRRHRSAILTPFMECTRQYAQLRYQLLLGADAATEEAVHRYLGHPKHGTFIWAKGPDGSAASMMNLGAYGSTMEGPLPASNPRQLQFILARMNEDDLAQMCAAMPPLYSRTIGISPRQVADADLIAALLTPGTGPAGLSPAKLTPTCSHPESSAIGRLPF